MASWMICSTTGRLPIIRCLRACASSGTSGRLNPVRYAIFLDATLCQWLNVETDETAKRLLTTNGAAVSSLPIVVFPDGSFLGNPSTAEIARKLGLNTKAEFPFYDLVVVGAGPAGLAASVYAAADGLHTLLIEREAPGGQAGRGSRLENYLGFPVW